jgi:hypothetical protein
MKYGSKSSRIGDRHHKQSRKGSKTKRSSKDNVKDNSRAKGTSLPRSILVQTLSHAVATLR